MKRYLAIFVPLVFGVASLAWGQFRGGGSDVDAHLARDDSFDGKFHYCRAVYRLNPRGDGGSWLTDYPGADVDLSIRLSELTKVRVSFNGAGEPNHLIVRLTGDELYRCPMILMQEVGRVLFPPEDAKALRTYLEKGGFLWVDDFWGSDAWGQWLGEIGRVLPSGEYPLIDVDSAHPMMHTLYEVKEVPQIPSINYWSRNGGDTSERGWDSQRVHFKAIVDDHRRVLVAMTHNTDIADSWEREGEDPRYFEIFSPRGYAIGVNFVRYAMTH